MSKTLKEYALEAADFFPIFPDLPRSKQPAVKGWTEGKATRDKGQISAWWDENPEYNIGVYCGGPTAFGLPLAVLDLDVDPEKGKDGVARLAKWCAAEGVEIPETATVRTGRGGLHLYFLADKIGLPDGADLFKDGSGVDFRAKGQVVAPGSIHPNGNRYKWEKHPAAYGIQPLPAAIEQLVMGEDTVPQSAETHPETASPTGEIPEGQRTTAMFKALSSLQAKGLGDKAIRAAIEAENADRCKPPLIEKELETTVFSALHRYKKGTASYELGQPYNVSLVDQLRELKPEKNKRYGKHDAGNGNLFSDLCKGVARFAPERKKWFFYDGVRWVDDPGSAHTMEYCKDVASALWAYAGALPDGEDKTAYAKFALKWQGLHYRETVLKDSSTVAPVKVADFDSDPFLFNCENGTLDLKTGQFHDHSPGDYITKLAPVHYDPNARCERWERFISEITCGDDALGAYIQKALGYALTGDAKDECLFILYGPTSRNGKGTLCETFLRLVGDYGRAANPETVGQRKYTDPHGPTEDVARLAGARFVNMSEADKSMRFDASTLKTLTGGGTGGVLTARFLGENSFQFRPQFKIFLDTNHLPYVNDTTVFASDRVNVIPFNRHFGAEERDPHLKATLQKPENLSGILNWCVEGLKRLNADGWTIPDAVKEASQDYEESSDKLGAFISEMLQETPGGKCSARAVHSKYQDWCCANGYKPEGFGEFKKSLASKAIEVKRGRLPNAGRDANKGQIVENYTIRATL